MNSELDHAEREQRAGVLRPALLGLLANAAEPVDDALERPEQRVEERPLALEHPRHEQAERLGQARTSAAKKRIWTTPTACHARTSVPLRAEQRDDQVPEQQRSGDDAIR